MDFLNTCFETTREVRSLALYSHLLPASVGVILGIYVYRLGSNRTVKSLFALFTALLAVWLLFDLVTWHSNNYFTIAAFWSVLDYINVLFYLVFLCFFIVLARQYRTIPWWILVVAVILAAPAFLVTFAGISVGDFDETYCEMSTNETLALYKLFVEVFSIVSVFSIGLLTVLTEWSKNKAHRNQILILTIPSMIFLGIFSGSEYLATLTNIYEITLYALFALPVFLAILTYSIVEQGTFGLRTSSYALAKLLFVIFAMVAGFSLVLTDDPYELGVTAVSTVVTAGFGILLLRSARREIKQREQIEQLAQGLERANDQLKVLDKMKSEFVSIASHQLRSPLTAIRGYSSMILEGSFGPVPEKAKDAVERISEASRFMASSVEDYLNVSRIQAGNMKYEYSDFNLKDLASRVADDTRQIAMKKGLLLTFKSDMSKTGIVHADIGKTRQIIDNLINNALKYTPKGSIAICVRDDAKLKKVYVEIQDTGIGMSERTIDNIFGKFKRADNANEINVTGTGLGLYIAKKMANEMKGDVTAHSDGEGKGSLFRITLPLLM